MDLVIIAGKDYVSGLPSEVVLFQKKPRLLNLIDLAIEMGSFSNICVYTNTTKKSILESYLSIYSQKEVSLVETNSDTGEIVYKHLKKTTCEKEIVVVKADFEVTDKELSRLAKFKLNRYNLAFPVVKKDSLHQFILNKDEECSCVKELDSYQKVFTNDFYFKCNKNILFYLENIRKVIFKDGKWLIPFNFYDVVHTMWADKRNYVVTYQEKCRIL